MTNNLYIPLQNRAVIAISGNDAETFLQGLITNDIKKVSKHKAIYALMLTPQGKFLYDFFILQIEDKYMLDCSLESLPQIIKKLSMYKLRSDVNIEDVSDKYEVVALIGDKVFEAVEHKNTGDVKQFCKGAAYIDPRTEKIFARAVIERENEYQSFKAYDFSEGEFEDYEFARINAIVPSGDSDLESEGSFPLDFGMNELNAIDYNKGCYVGQEVTARVHHKGTLRKKIYLLQTNDESPFPASETEIKIADEKAGKRLSATKNVALAILKQEIVEKNKKMCIICDTEITIKDSI
jgi:folate-binding protein YgfZ